MMNDVKKDRILRILSFLMLLMHLIIHYSSLTIHFVVVIQQQRSTLQVLLRRQIEYHTKCRITFLVVGPTSVSEWKT